MYSKNCLVTWAKCASCPTRYWFGMVTRTRAPWSSTAIPGYWLASAPILRLSAELAPAPRGNTYNSGWYFSSFPCLTSIRDFDP